MFLNALECDDAAKRIIKSRAEPSRAEPSPSSCPPERVRPRLSGCRSGRPPSLLPSASCGAPSDPLPTDFGGSAPSPSHRERTSAYRHLGRRGRSLSACIRSAAAVLLLGWVSLLGAGAALADTLVSNADQTARGGNIVLRTTEVAQAFTTGSNATGYTLTAVKLEFGSGHLASFPDSGDTITVKITDGLTATSSTVATLTSPVTWCSTSTFTAPASRSLMASTTYYVVVEGGSGSTHTTTSASEDSGGASGWTIANALEFRGTVSSGSSRTWRTGSHVLRITIEGDTNFNAAADARLDTLAVADATLSPRFGPGTTSYTAVVANSVTVRVPAPMATGRTSRTVLRGRPMGTATP